LKAAPILRPKKTQGIEMKLIYIDVETTGIECPESGLLQLAGAIEIDGQVAQEFNHRMRPFPADKICEEALEVNGLSKRPVKGIFLFLAYHARMFFSVEEDIHDDCEKGARM
jgi:hypothetical protein